MLFRSHELADSVPHYYFEPGMMEYLDQSDGMYDEHTGILKLKFESKGTRYGDRTEQIETLSAGDPVKMERDPENEFNSNTLFFISPIKILPPSPVLSHKDPSWHIACLEYCHRIFAFL